MIPMVSIAENAILSGSGETVLAGFNVDKR
jgi:hypothetical protein